MHVMHIHILDIHVYHAHLICILNTDIEMKFACTLMIQIFTEWWKYVPPSCKLNVNLIKKYHILLIYSFVTFQVRMKPDRVCKIVVACAVLHNICISLKEPEYQEEIEEEDVQPPPMVFQGQQDGRGVRDYVTRHCFSRV